jgi:hypothetical protein
MLSVSPEFLEIINTILKNHNESLHSEKVFIKLNPEQKDPSTPKTISLEINGDKLVLRRYYHEVPVSITFLITSFLWGEADLSPISLENSYGFKPCAEYKEDSWIVNTKQQNYLYLVCESLVKDFKNEGILELIDPNLK